MLELNQTLEGHVGRVWHCAWSPNGEILATCGEDKSIRLWSKEGSSGFKCKTVLSEGHTRTIRQICWSPCGKFLASASFDGTAVIWDKSGGKFECTTTLEGHENEVKSVAYSPSGEFLATCSRDKSVWLWQHDEDDDELICASVLQAHTQDVKKVVWNPNEDILSSCSYDNKIKLFKEEGDDWVCFATLTGHESTVWSIDYHSSGSYLASVSEDKSLKIWKEHKLGNPQGIESSTNKSDPVWKPVINLTGEHSRCIYDVSWNKIAKDLIATACGDNYIRVFRMKPDQENGNESESLELLSSFKDAHDEDVNAIEWNPKIENLLASTSDDGTVKIWDYKNE